MNRISNFVCLANSKKFSGRCIAGKMQDAKGNWVWVRPVGGAGGKRSRRMIESIMMVRVRKFSIS